MKAILNKLWGNKTNVKTDLRAVKLSKVNELQDEHNENLQRLQNTMNPVLNAISEAKEGLSEIQDELDGAYLTSSKVLELIESVEELGVEVPDQLRSLYNETEALADIGDVQIETETNLQNAEDVISNIYQKYF